MPGIGKFCEHEIIKTSVLQLERKYLVSGVAGNDELERKCSFLMVVYEKDMTILSLRKKTREYLKSLYDLRSQVQ